MLRVCDIRENCAAVLSRASGERGCSEFACPSIQIRSSSMGDVRKDLCVITSLLLMQLVLEGSRVQCQTYSPHESICYVTSMHLNALLLEVFIRLELKKRTVLARWNGPSSSTS
jgi:hypothetical protein